MIRQQGKGLSPGLPEIVSLMLGEGFFFFSEVEPDLGPSDDTT